MMRDEGTFTRMVGLIQSVPMDEDGLRRLLLQLMYEMARIQQLDWEDLRMASSRPSLASCGFVEGGC